MQAPDDPAQTATVENTLFSRIHYTSPASAILFAMV